MYVLPCHRLTEQDYFGDITKENENKRVQAQMMEDDGDGTAKKMKTTHQFEVEEKHVNWVEIIYSTVVESFSVMDLYTDIVIFIQLLSRCISIHSLCILSHSYLL